MKGDTKGEYENDAEYFIRTKPDLALKIIPMQEAEAKTWLGVANQYGDQELVKHFAACAKEASQ